MSNIIGGTNVCWEERQVMTRFRYRPNLDNKAQCDSVLMIKVIILRKSQWDTVHDGKKRLLSWNESSTIRLWQKKCLLICSMNNKRFLESRGTMMKHASLANSNSNASPRPSLEGETVAEQCSVAMS